MGDSTYLRGGFAGFARSPTLTSRAGGVLQPVACVGRGIVAVSVLVRDSGSMGYVTRHPASVIRKACCVRRQHRAQSNGHTIYHTHKHGRVCVDIGWPELHVERLYAAVGALVSCELSLTWATMATAMGGKVASGKWQAAKCKWQVSTEHRVGVPSARSEYQD